MSSEQRGAPETYVAWNERRAEVSNYRAEDYKRMAVDAARGIGTRIPSADCRLLGAGGTLVDESALLISRRLMG
jgi:hypothetical protein